MLIRGPWELVSEKNGIVVLTILLLHVWYFLYFLITAKREEGFVCFEYCYGFLSAISSRFFSSVSCPFRVPCSYLAFCYSHVTLTLSYFSMLLKYYCKTLSSLVITLLTYLPKMLICWVQLCYQCYKSLYMVISYTGLVCLLTFTFRACQLCKFYAFLLWLQLKNSYSS